MIYGTRNYCGDVAPCGKNRHLSAVLWRNKTTQSLYIWYMARRYDSYPEMYVMPQGYHPSPTLSIAILEAIWEKLDTYWHLEHPLVQCTHLLEENIIEWQSVQNRLCKGLAFGWSRRTIQHKCRPGPRFNLKISPYQYRKSHCGDKTVARSSYLHSGISYTGKTTSLY